MPEPLRKLLHSPLALVLLAYIAFISLGLPDGLLGVAWPSMRAGFGLPLDALGLLLMASMSGYLTSSFFSGRLLARLGVGGVLSASCLLTGASLLSYTLVPAWWMLLMLGVCAGLGIGAIDAALNTYIASQHGEGLMQWLHASFGIGVTFGPLIMTFGIRQFDSWRPGYQAVGAFQMGLGLCFALTARLWRRTPAAPNDDAPLQRLMDYNTPLRATLRQSGAWLSILLFFLCTGVELSLGHWAYSLLTESRGIDPQVAGLWVGSYWAAFTTGRFLAGLVAKRLGINRLLRATLLLGLAGAVLLCWNPGQAASLAGVAVIGFSIAPVFPALVSGTVLRVGLQHAANTIGIQISAAGLGAALVPALAGVLARNISLEVIPILLVVLFSLLFTIFSLSVRKVQALQNGSMYNQ